LQKGVRRLVGANPETGPFYVETAMRGDVLVAMPENRRSI
jgi:acetamidase/formamidase